MKYIAIFLSLFFATVIVNAQPIWSVCVNERRYQYVGAKDNGFRIINKPITFCYNDYYFGFVTGNGYVEVYPIESYSMSTNEEGYIVESFLNGRTENYEEGDYLILITHSKPATVLINYTRFGGHAYYIETNDLYTGKVKKAASSETSKQKVSQLPQVAKPSNFTKEELQNMVIVRLSKPIDLKQACIKLSIDSALLNKWNTDYSEFIAGKIAGDYYLLRIPKTKLDSFITLKETFIINK